MTRANAVPTAPTFNPETPSKEDIMTATDTTYAAPIRSQLEAIKAIAAARVLAETRWTFQFRKATAYDGGWTVDVAVETLSGEPVAVPGVKQPVRLGVVHPTGESRYKWQVRNHAWKLEGLAMPTRIAAARMLMSELRDQVAAERLAASRAREESGDVCQECGSRETVADPGLDGPFCGPCGERIYAELNAHDPDAAEAVRADTVNALPETATAYVHFDAICREVSNWAVGDLRREQFIRELFDLINGNDLDTMDRESAHFIREALITQAFDTAKEIATEVVTRNDEYAAETEPEDKEDEMDENPMPPSDDYLRLQDHVARRLASEREDLRDWYTAAVDEVEDPLFRDPLRRFEWGESAVRTAAVIRVLEIIEASLRTAAAEGRVGTDPDELKVIDGILAHARAKTHNAALYPRRSGSPMHDLAESEEVRAWADLTGLIESHRSVIAGS